MVVEFFNRPAMLGWEVKKLGKSRVAKAKADTGIVRLWDAAGDGVHKLIQQPAMRNHQITRRFTFEQVLQCLTRTQEQFPIPFPIRADRVVGRGEIGVCEILPHLMRGQPGEFAVIPFQPERFELDHQAKFGGDDLRRFSRP